MRRALLLVSPQLFVDAFKGRGLRTFAVESNPLPDDAQLVDVAYINAAHQVALELESASFPDVAERQVLAPPVCRVSPPPAPLDTERLQTIADAAIRSWLVQSRAAQKQFGPDLTAPDRFTRLDSLAYHVLRACQQVLGETEAEST